MPEGSRLTLSVVKADVGGFIGHISSHPDVLDTAKERLFNAKEKGQIADFHVLRCGDDLELILTHAEGAGSTAINKLVYNTFTACYEAAKELKLYGGDGFGSDMARGPCAAEMEFDERESEPIAIFMANKTTTGAWNLPLYKIYADPFNTSGLITDPRMFEGFSFKILDLAEGKDITLSAPCDGYALLTLAGISSRFLITSVKRNKDAETAAVVACRRINQLGASLQGKESPVIILRCQAGFPAVGEALEAFTVPHLVEGWMRESHVGPLMPVSFYEAHPTRFDGPPRVIGAGFQISNGRLIGPHDLFDDPSFDETRRLANRIAEYMRRHGPFQPHRLPQIEMGQTALPAILDKLK
ncbi:MAG: fructose 1,6-bisphosphatase, partial [Deltaproteobacteria bacterium]|nr:fructose 1,6-bisphosphatase [Deltaproteobacteria bacterium]